MHAIRESNKSIRSKVGWKSLPAKRVSFTSMNKYKTIPVVDPQLKSDLYYSRKEMDDMKFSFEMAMINYKKKQLMRKMNALMCREQQQQQQQAAGISSQC